MKYYHRQLEKVIRPVLSRREIVAIKGPRQAGKTTLLQHLYQQMSSKKKCLFITFEKRTDLDLFETDIENFKKLYAEKYPVIFIDEFQYAKEGGQKLKYLYDTTFCKFIISGSSSLELTGQTGKYLVGRMLSYELYPFSFAEFLQVINEDMLRIIGSQQENIGQLLRLEESELEQTEPIKSASLKEQFVQLLFQYIVFGGYPAVCLTDEAQTKKTILQGILDTYLLRDIKSLLQLATDRQLLIIAKFLSLQVGNLLVYKELSNASSLSFHQVKRHLHILQETYLADFLLPFYTNKRKELSKNPKVYFLDTGLRNLLGGDFSNLEQRSDRGALLENFVFTTLKRKLKIGQQIKYWRTQTQAEVDFVLEAGRQLLPVEVKYQQGKNIKPGKSFYSFIEKYQPKNGVVVTVNYWGKIKINNSKIYFIPGYYL